MLRSLSKAKKGFTIIEVLIVLAIAALIMLIIFLAVPALQRSSRNTQRKNDVAAISSAIANFITNNGGALPTADGKLTGAGADTTALALFCSGATITNVTSLNTAPAAFSNGCQTTNTNYEQAKLGYYVPADAKIFFENATGSTFQTIAVGSETADKISTNSITIDLGYSCNSTNTGAGSTVNSRTAAILYVTETGSGNGSLGCTEQ